MQINKAASFGAPFLFILLRSCWEALCQTPEALTVSKTVTYSFATGPKDRVGAEELE
jgi:hypothetical protein